MDAPVDILLGTWNGERFLPELLESLERQTVGRWQLIARDDRSTDGTGALLADFQRRHRDSVRLIEDASGRLGAKANFGRLMDASTADYSLFCDQDDVWMPNKIELLLGEARRSEKPDRPLLVHSDLAVVDENLLPVAPSFWAFQGLRPERCRWQQLLVQNVVTGCASMFNAALRRAASPLPVGAMMHDWWVGLVAAATGDLRWVNAPTIRYRQHGANDTGAKRWGLNQWRYTFKALFLPVEYRAWVRGVRQQAAALAAHDAAVIPEATRSVLRTFSHLDQLSYAERVRFVRHHGIAKTGVIRSFVFLRNL